MPPKDITARRGTKNRKPPTSQEVQDAKARQLSRTRNKIFNNSNSPKVVQRGNILFVIAKSGLEIPFAFGITLVIIFIGAIGSAMSHAQITNTEQAIVAARAALVSYQNDNTTLEAQIFNRYTTDEIERIARLYLGMEFPDPSQIIDIYVPRLDNVVLNIDENILPREVSFWQSTTEFISGLFNRMLGGV